MSHANNDQYLNESFKLVRSKGPVMSKNNNYYSSQDTNLTLLVNYNYYRMVYNIIYHICNAYKVCPSLL